MRILQVNSASTWGGGETHVLELTESLRQRDHDVIIAGRPNSPLKPQLELPFLNSADLLTAFRLRRLLKKERFDIVHAHLARDYTIVAGALRGLPKPNLVFTRHLLHPVRQHFLYQRVDAWIAPTAQILDTIRPLATKAAVVIPNWVDTGKFVYLPHPLHSPINVGIVGQISPHKGHEDAIAAVEQLGENFRLLIAGEGDTDYKAKLKQQSAGVPVEFVGFRPAATLFPEIDILIMPSWEEPFGIVLLEAMASGIPVIATDAGGPREILSGPADGVLIPARDPGALANAIKSVAADENRRSAMVRQARLSIEARFDIRLVMPRIEELYQRVSYET